MADNSHNGPALPGQSHGTIGIPFMGATTAFTVEEERLAADLGCSFTQARRILAERRAAQTAADEVCEAIDALGVANDFAELIYLAGCGEQKEHFVRGAGAVQQAIRDAQARLEKARAILNGAA